MAKVNITQDVRNTEFEYVGIGEWFIFNGVAYIKIAKSNVYDNTINVETDEIGHFCSEASVTVIPNYCINIDIKI